MIIAVPRGLDFFGPKPLQIRRQTARARRTDEQVAAVLVIQRKQRGIVAALFQGHQTAVRGQQRGGATGGLAIVQAQAHAVEKLLVIRHVRAAQIRPGNSGGFVQIGEAGGHGVSRLAARETAKIRGGGDVEQHFIRVLHF